MYPGLTVSEVSCQSFPNKSWRSFFAEESVASGGVVLLLDGDSVVLQDISTNRVRDREKDRMANGKFLNREGFMLF
jgi:hypothetical protein